MRIKAGDPMKPVERHVNFFREVPQLLSWQISELPLDSPQLVENQRLSPRTGRSMKILAWKQSRRCCRAVSSDIANPLSQVHRRNASSLPEWETILLFKNRCCAVRWVASHLRMERIAASHSSSAFSIAILR